jgi:hypothetical protein
MITEPASFGKLRRESDNCGAAMMSQDAPHNPHRESLKRLNSGLQTRN